MFLYLRTHINICLYVYVYVSTCCLPTCNQNHTCQFSSWYIRNACTGVPVCSTFFPDTRFLSSEVSPVCFRVSVLFTWQPWAFFPVGLCWAPGLGWVSEGGACCPALWGVLFAAGLSKHCPFQRWWVAVHHLVLPGMKLDLPQLSHPVSFPHQKAFCLKPVRFLCSWSEDLFFPVKSADLSLLHGQLLVSYDWSDRFHAHARFLSLLPELPSSWAPNSTLNTAESLKTTEKQYFRRSLWILWQQGKFTV